MCVRIRGTYQIGFVSPVRLHLRLTIMEPVSGATLLRHCIDASRG